MTRQHIRVVLIEDNPGDVRLVREMLSESSTIVFELACADRLAAGLDLIAQEPCDVVLLDLSLPDSQGLATIRNLAEKVGGLPIVVLTGTSDETLGTKAVQAGAQDYLIKAQIDAHLLARTLSYAIERQRLIATLEHQNCQLEASERRLRTLITANADGIVVVDQNGEIVLVNPAAEALFARQADHLLGKPFGIPLVTSEVTELELQHAGGQPTTASMRMVEIDWEGDKAYLASLRDITEKREADRRKLELALERQRMKLLADFIADAAHEFRTPLTVISTSLYLLEKTQNTEKRERLLTRSREQVNYIEDLVRALLTMFQLDSGMVFETNLFSLDHLLHDVQGIIAEQSGGKDIAVEILNGANDPTIIGDRFWLCHALTNIFTNAVQHTPSGGRIICETCLEADYTVIQVKDSGRGISVADLPHVFDRFYRGDKSRTTRGVGLGLSIAKKIIEEHNGTIAIKSVEGHGCTATVALPTAVAKHTG